MEIKQDLNLVLVDDNKACNFYHNIMIKEAGIPSKNVKEFLYANESIDYLRELVKEKNTSLYPDVILLDINMPIKNGWQMIDELAQIEFGNKTPKIFLVSNSRHPADIERAASNPLVVALLEKHLGVDFFLQIKKEHLNAQIE